MKKFLLTLIMMCLGVGNVAAAEAIPVRGVVEGFYGTPWTHEQRMDMVQFIGSEGMNAYIYAPKDDPYHRDKWREDYPQEQQKQLKELQQTAEKAGVELIFAVSPGLDIDFTGKNKKNDRQAMENKLQMMYDMGVRQFALFFDDIQTKDPIGQAEFANYINRHFVELHPDCRPLIFVPTEYFLLDMESDGIVKEYTGNLSSKLDKNIHVLYTGRAVCPDGLTEEDIARTSAIYAGRDTGIWWNYPVNDYLHGDEYKLALGPLDKMPKRADVGSFFVNPMDRPALSKIAILTAAEFTANPASYDEETAWQRAIRKLYGQYGDEVLEAMFHLAGANQRLVSSWCQIGRLDEGEVTESDMEILKKNLPVELYEEIVRPDDKVSYAPPQN